MLSIASTDTRADPDRSLVTSIPLNPRRPRQVKGIEFGRAAWLAWHGMIGETERPDLGLRATLDESEQWWTPCTRYCPSEDHDESQSMTVPR